MPRKSSPYNYHYQQLRARILQGGRQCAYCSRPATETDHVPPVTLHNHAVKGCRLCHLVPSCATCARRQGGLLAHVHAAVSDADFQAAFVEPIGFDVLHPVWDVPWLDDLRDVPESAVWPRLMTVPHPNAEGSYGDAFEAWCRAEFGVSLRWWQRLVASRLLEHDGEGRLLWRTLVLSTSRQVGKSTLLSAILLWRMVDGADRFGEEQLLLHIARQTDAAREVQRPARNWAKARADRFKVIDANGKESIEHLESHSRWLARAEDAVYSLSATSALADEAWDITAAVVDEGIEPTLVEHVQPQLLLTSTAHRRATSLMPGRRSTAVQSLGDGLDGDLLMEWSAPRAAEHDDETAWRLASPHWTDQREERIGKALARAMSGETLDPSEPDPMESFRAQWLNIWPVASFRGKGSDLVAPETWKGLRDDTIESVGPLVLAVEDCFGRGASAAAAGMSADGRIVVGGWCFDSRAGAYEFVERWVNKSEDATVLVGVLLRDDQQVADLPTIVEPRGTTDTRAALSLFRELVTAGRVVQDGSDVELQVGGARVTPAPSGGLQLVNSDRFDLVRAAAWAVAEVHRRDGLAPAVFGGL